MEKSEKKLNKEQEYAVQYFDGPLLIVAGAGTGKTKVITEKIRYLVHEKNVSPDNILALTFTEKTANEMQERVESLFDLGVAEFHISTFHAFCQSILEQWGLDIGIPNRFKLLTETDAWMLMREHLGEFNLEYYRPMGNPTRHIHELLRHFSKCKDEMISPQDYLNYAENLRLETDNVHSEEKNKFLEIANAYHTYNQLLLDNSCLDFGDLIFFTNKLLLERPSIRKKIQQKFQYILVDEFQDVNYAQYILTHTLGEGSQLTVVGDDDQSIYAFRGASVSNILRFQEDFPTAKSAVLTENYRSAQSILDIAYTSIQNNNPDRLEVKLQLNKKLIARGKTQKSFNGIIEYIESSTVDEEVSQVMNRITQMKQKSPELAWNDFAILVRANAHAHPFIRGLQNAGIPYDFRASEGLFKQPAVLDALSILRVIDSQSNSLSLYRILCLPCIQMPNEDVQKITDFAKRKTISYYETIQKAAEFHVSVQGLEKIHQILSWIQECARRSVQEKPSKILYSFLEQSGYFSLILKDSNAGESQALHQVYQIKEFFEFLANYESEHAEANIPQFLQYHDFLLDSGDEGTGVQIQDTPDSVQVMTVHAAKGLEFEYVFVVNLVEERFPTRRRGEAIELPIELIKDQLPQGDYHIQEERRLFYVAVTRAKTGLFFTAAKSYGGVREKKISRFLIELGYGKQEKPIQKAPIHEFFSDMTQMDPTHQARSNQQLYPIPKSFSFSQLQTYASCPYKYKLAHIIKIPTKGNASFSFGTTMHSTLQKFYERMQEMNAQKQSNLFDTLLSPTDEQKSNLYVQIKAPSLEELIEIYEQSFISDWYKDKRQREEYFTKGKEIIRTFYKAHQEQWNIPVALESSFQIQVGNFTLKGRIDRIDALPDGTIEIIDYKTGKSKEKLSIEDRQQLFLYQIVAQKSQAYKNLGTVSKLTFYYLNDQIKTSFFGNEKELADFQEKIIGNIQKIHSREFIATPSSVVCAHCEFRDICEYRIL